MLVSCLFVCLFVSLVVSLLTLLASELFNNYKANKITSEHVIVVRKISRF